MRITIVTSTWVTVDGRSGEAKRVLVYEMSAGGIKLVKDRFCHRAKTTKRTHPSNLKWFGAVRRAVGDCMRTFVRQIGRTPNASPGCKHDADYYRSSAFFQRLTSR